MVRRKYLINLIALYGLINTINSANGELSFNNEVSRENVDTVWFAIFRFGCFFSRALTDHRLSLPFVSIEREWFN